MGVRGFNDPEIQAAASRKGVEARERARALREGPPDAQIEAATPKLVAELLDAALGKGDFASLKPSDRLKALQTALAYGLGRPGARQTADDGPEAPSAAALFGLPAPE